MYDDCFVVMKIFDFDFDFDFEYSLSHAYYRENKAQFTIHQSFIDSACSPPQSTST